MTECSRQALADITSCCEKLLRKTKHLSELYENDCRAFRDENARLVAKLGVFTLEAQGGSNACKGDHSLIDYLKQDEDKQFLCIADEARVLLDPASLSPHPPKPLIARAEEAACLTRHTFGENKATKIVLDQIVSDSDGSDSDSHDLQLSGRRTQGHASNVSSPGNASRPSTPIKNSLRAGSFRSKLGESSFTNTTSIMNMRQRALASFNIASQGNGYDEWGFRTGIRSDEAVALHRKFAQLDHDGNGRISMHELARHCMGKIRPALIQPAVNAVNVVLGPSHRFGQDEISLETFEVMMLASDEYLRDVLGEQHADTILTLRSAFVFDSVQDGVALACNLDNAVRSTLTLSKLEVFAQRDHFKTLFEPIVACVIVLNGLVIGISLDNSPEWIGWDVLSVVFVIFFVVELMFRFIISGPSEHFFGEDSAWNWFDFLCVVFGIIDTIFIFLDRLANSRFNTFTVLRLAKLARIFRLARLVHLNFFKELTLLLNGVFGGLRTLFWAIVILFFLLYFFGILLRQAMDPKLGCESAMGAVENRTTEAGQAEHCNRGERQLDMYGPILYSTVTRSMVTVFECFMESCSAPDGTPMIWYWWDTHGAVVVVSYVLAYVLVTFGVFNLILAIFIENTLNYAHVAEQIRTARRRGEAFKKAQLLQGLLMNIFTSGETNFCANLPWSARSAWTLIKSLTTHRTRQHPGQDVPTLQRGWNDRRLELRVTQADFAEALKRDEVQRLLSDLDVSRSCCDRLFEILDSDGNGYLSLAEFAEGVMKLRGSIDKGDVVSVMLMMRRIQKHMTHLETAVMESQRVLKKHLKGNAEKANFHAGA